MSASSGAEGPTYYRLYRDTWEAVSTLPRAQAAKLLYAMAAHFFDGSEPADGDLPRQARAFYDLQRTALESYRRNAINGARNRSKPEQKPTEEQDQETLQVFDPSQHHLPAETRKVGGEHPAKGASNITNHKSISMTTAAAVPPAQHSGGGATSPEVATIGRLDTMGREPRASAGAARVRPAAALPPRAEYDRVRRKLADEGLDALTGAEREAYRAGWQEYERHQ